MPLAFLVGILSGVMFMWVILGITRSRLHERDHCHRTVVALALVVNSAALTPVTMSQLQGGRTFTLWLCFMAQTLALVAGLLAMVRHKESH